MCWALKPDNFVTNPQYGPEHGDRLRPSPTLRVQPRVEHLRLGYHAAMTRQWANYVSTFVPIENQLIKYATDPNVVSNAMSEASRDVNASFDAQAGTSSGGCAPPVRRSMPISRPRNNATPASAARWLT